MVPIAYLWLEEISVWDRALSKGEHEGIEYDASSKKSDDELKPKKPREGHSKQEKKLGNKRPSLHVFRNKKGNRDKNIQGENPTPKQLIASRIKSWVFSR